MAYDKGLAEVVRDLLDYPEIVEKRMFGGLCFMLRGNMVGGVEGSRLIVRVGKELYEEALQSNEASPMDFTGRPLPGFVFVDPSVCGEHAIPNWLELALTYNRTLPDRTTGAKLARE